MRVLFYPLLLSTHLLLPCRGRHNLSPRVTRSGYVAGEVRPCCMLLSCASLLQHTKVPCPCSVTMVGAPQTSPTSCWSSSSPNYDQSTIAPLDLFTSGHVNALSFSLCYTFNSTSRPPRPWAMELHLNLHPCPTISFSFTCWTMELHLNLHPCPTISSPFTCRTTESHPNLHPGLVHWISELHINLHLCLTFHLINYCSPSLFWTLIQAMPLLLLVYPFLWMDYSLFKVLGFIWMEGTGFG